MIKKILLLLFLCATSALHAANYLTFTAKADRSSFGIRNKGGNDPDVQYSLNNGETWTKLKNNTLIDLPNKKKALIKGYNPEGISKTYRENTCFVMTGRIAASGSVMSLIDGKGESLDIPGEYCFYQLFMRCDGLTQAPQLPATTLAKDCYGGMFSGCTNLKQAPELPATTLEKECYEGMFWECTSLVQAPQLPATQLADSCYAGMFSKCENLKQAPQLPATTLDTSCYLYMFKGCYNLAQAPELPATQLAWCCYTGMFNECSSLTQAPKLPATQLAEGCYAEMFKGCTSLTQAPELPATTLGKDCYAEMFSGCSKLAEIKVGFTQWTEYDWYGEKRSNNYNWLSGVAPNGTFIGPIKLPEEFGQNRIPEGWKVIEN